MVQNFSRLAGFLITYLTFQSYMEQTIYKSIQFGPIRIEAVSSLQFGKIILFQDKLIWSLIILDKQRRIYSQLKMWMQRLIKRNNKFSMQKKKCTPGEFCEPLVTTGAETSALSEALVFCNFCLFEYRCNWLCILSFFS